MLRLQRGPTINREDNHQILLDLQGLEFRKVNKNNGMQVVLFLISLAIYGFYFSHLLTHLNTVLYSADGDSLKNYFTFVYHVKNDPGLLEFSGLNFPYGEHIVYTDGQPLLALLLKALPFSHNHLIGILHALILLSFAITPVILFRIFLLLKLNSTAAFFSSLAIALLSPQMHRLGGHFALAYGCVIPFGILLLLNYLKTRSGKQVAALFAFNSLLFFVHPYFGLGLSAFCFLSIVLNTLLNYKNNRVTLARFLKLIVIGIAPIVVFKLFMAFTDHHVNRPDEPYGVDIMGAAANAESVFTPSFGPFSLFLKGVIKSPHVEWEAFAYIGFFPLLFLIATVFLLPFYLMRLKMRTEITAVFLASCLFLAIAFGAHIGLLDLFGIKIATLNQFRAFGRFAWYFYFLLPIFLLTQFANFARTFAFKAQRIILPVLGIVFFLLNLLEGHYLFGTMTTDRFTARNIFNASLLTPTERNMVNTIKAGGYQAIVPLPVFHIGSEVYQRNGDASVAPAMFYAYHTALPVLSVMLSRTSLNESETALEMLNRYKANRPLLSRINSQPLLVMKTGTELKQDEARLLRQVRAIGQEGAQEFYVASKNNFILSADESREFKSTTARSVNGIGNTVFIPTRSSKPFTSADINAYETIITLEPGQVQSGDYTVSFHYYLKEKKFRYIHNHLIVVRQSGKEEVWDYFMSVRSTSGFYDGFVVFEEKIRIDGQARYQFLLHGPMNEPYRIANFLLKPDTLDLKMQDGSRVLYNNYPN